MDFSQGFQRLGSWSGWSSLIGELVGETKHAVHPLLRDSILPVGTVRTLNVKLYTSAIIICSLFSIPSVSRGLLFFLQPPEFPAQTLVIRHLLYISHLETSLGEKYAASVLRNLSSQTDVEADILIVGAINTTATHPLLSSPRKNVAPEEQSFRIRGHE